MNKKDSTLLKSSQVSARMHDHAIDYVVLSQISAVGSYYFHIFGLTTLFGALDTEGRECLGSFAAFDSNDRKKERIYDAFGCSSRKIFYSLSGFSREAFICINH